MGLGTLAVLRLGTTGELVSLPFSSPSSMCSANGREVGERAASPQLLPLISASLATSAGQIRTVFSGLHVLTLRCVHVRSSPALGGLHRPGENLPADKLHHRLCCEDSAPMVPCDGRDSIPHVPRARSEIMSGLLSMLQRAHELWDVLGAPFLSLS